MELNEQISRKKLLVACKIVECDLMGLKSKIETTENLNLDILKSVKGSELGLLVESFVTGFIESDYLEKLLLACQTVEKQLSTLKEKLEDTSISDTEISEIFKDSRLGFIVKLKLPIVEKQLYLENLGFNQKVKKL